MTFCQTTAFRRKTACSAIVSDFQYPIALVEPMVYIMVRNLHLPNGERQTWANSIQKKPKRHDCMQRNCCCNEKIAELRNLLTYPWVELKKKAQCFMNSF
jgi:hypothetical protein